MLFTTSVYALFSIGAFLMFTNIAACSITEFASTGTSFALVGSGGIKLYLLLPFCV